MDLAKIRQALGLPADASEEKVLAAATALAKAAGDLAKGSARRPTPIPPRSRRPPPRSPPAGRPSTA